MIKSVLGKTSCVPRGLVEIPMADCDEETPPSIALELVWWVEARYRVKIDGCGKCRSLSGRR